MKIKAKSSSSVSDAPEFRLNGLEIDLPLSVRLTCAIMKQRAVLVARALVVFLVAVLRTFLFFFEGSWDERNRRRRG
jgi:hypothetical protein